MTWDDIARMVDVKRCLGCANGNHDRGWAQRSTYTVHWGDRRLTKLGLRRFLMLAAAIRLLPVEREWERLYAYNIWSVSKAREMHIRIPARFADNDRARVRWLTSGENDVPPSVRRWARRRHTHG